MAHLSDILEGRSIFITSNKNKVEMVGEIYTFYIDVGSLPPSEAVAYIDRIRESMLRKPAQENKPIANTFCDEPAPWNPEPKRTTPSSSLALRNTCMMIQGHTGDHQWYNPTYPNCNLCPVPEDKLESIDHIFTGNQLNVSEVISLLGGVEDWIDTNQPNRHSHCRYTLPDGRVGIGCRRSAAFAQLFPEHSA